MILLSIDFLLAYKAAAFIQFFALLVWYTSLSIIFFTQSIGSLDKGIFCSIMHITDHFLLSTVQMLDRQESLLWSWFSVRDQLAKHVKLLLNAANLCAKTYNGPRYNYLILTCNFGLFVCLSGRLQRENEANFSPAFP